MSEIQKKYKDIYIYIYIYARTYNTYRKHIRSIRIYKQHVYITYKKIHAKQKKYKNIYKTCQKLGNIRHIKIF